MSNRKGIMLCYPFEEKRLARWAPPYIVQPKYDGVRCRALNINGEWVLLSSEENVIHSVPHINELLPAHSSVIPYELDGELYCHGMSFEQIVSITSRTANLHPDYRSISFKVFDIADESYPQLIRTKLVNELIGSLSNPYISAVPYYICNSLDEVMRAYDKIIEAGYEGIIVRHLGGMYIRKRSPLIMKFKPKQSDTYIIIGYAEEVSIDGIPKGRMGALTCTCGDTVFNVGTGFDDEDRHNLWQVRDQLIGKQVKINYQHLTDKKVPRFPVFVEVLGMEEEKRELARFFVAGAKHYGLANIINKLEEGQELTLLPEPDNKYDHNAIKVLAGDTMLGYVPKTDNQKFVVNECMAKVRRVLPNEPSYRQLRISVFEK